MEIAVNTLFLGLNPKIIINHKKPVDGFTSKLTGRSSRVSHPLRFDAPEFRAGRSREYLPGVSAVLSSEDVGVSSSLFDEFSVSRTSTSEARELTVGVEVFSVRTRAIFDNVFDRMVAAAQPIRGFRRVKGGKTPNIPREILLEILGPSKVYKEVIMEVINSTIAEYVEKEGLKVGKDLRVEQSLEDLEAKFEPGEKFSFDVVVQLQEMN
ncbi:uncharacterized protein LOC133879493 isoform X2 [Alnus glutinosa]|uniref:uncharacterized protein LOC133879493 isoform X2 n=1 Tax=Alnus glutinosa TaxID=3517 RepID=UPI002D77FD33|nr:uncharacterized protein LOC133879493 isoform X2 [Alnus glutinosa]